jgi:glycosyltransferase involved in cell wall biosynthesis
VSVSLAVIWIDWYAYHVARFRALAEHPALRGRVAGVELVGGSGVHQSMVFRCADRGELPISTLLPGNGWSETKQEFLAKLLWRKLDELDPEVVLVPGYYTAPALAAALWAKRHHRQAILMTETTRGDHERIWWKEAAKRRVIRSLFDAAVAGGRRHVAYLEELQFPESRIGRFYDVVDNEFFRNGVARARSEQSRAELAAPDRYFLYVGRLSAEKNLEALIRCFAQVRRRGSNSSLVLAGDGPFRGHLEDQVGEAGLEHWVRFAGLKSTAELLPYYAFAEAVVLPSRREPWGLVVNEAMAAGLPVIVSNRCGCAGDLVEHGINGFLFEPDREEELTDALCLADRASPAERESMGRRSEEIISRYSVHHWAEEVLRLVRTVAFAGRTAA